jgi:WD40 repeat protein
MTVSPDAKWLVTGSDDHTARLWNLATGKLERVFHGHSERVTWVDLTGGGKRLATASNDETIRIWNVETGKELCQLVSFDDGGWAVLDSAGRFDAANQGDVQGLHWVIGNETFPLARFRNHFYEPGLLAKHMGLSQEPLRAVGKLPTAVRE